ncbi:YugN-like family protein [Paenibacillus glycanilyticus]|uniref:YugN-like family protein n=1 Tax=Paenibacillus glycanilyticus TaxID=126569 RepID=UPI00203BD48E|nr:YugN-like family protein [Paenibacillus glycanilyticus]MCM3629215.1 YugN-like family protein [Paenibacillus glycanilyticus]
MIPISSSLEARQQAFTDSRDWLQQHQFSLGGNWDYTNGSFDRALDEENKVWLRLPFEVTNGSVVDVTADTNAIITFETPYVLRHEYQEGNDPEASARVVGALFDQFQAPSNPDAHVDSKWVDKAKDVLKEVEKLFPQ